MNPEPISMQYISELCLFGDEGSLPDVTTKKRNPYRSIEIRNCSIQWIELADVGYGDSMSGSVQYMIPDKRKLPKIGLYSNGAKWSGNDRGTGLKDILNQEIAILSAIARSCDIQIYSSPEEGYWAIKQERFSWNKPHLQQSQWEAYKKIAEILLHLHSIQ